MPKVVRIPPGNGFTGIEPSSFSIEVDTPNRSDTVVFTVTRTSAIWPIGPLFSYTIYERNRGSSQLNLMTSGTEFGTGEPAADREGNITNPPFRRTAKWAPAQDRDVVRIDIEVFQTFNTSMTVEFL
jgi:hypothetical protein